MIALKGGKADRLPVTIHQWQQFHLDEYMDGMDALSAFKAVGMDAAIQYFEAMGQFWVPDAQGGIVQTPEWKEEIKEKLWQFHKKDAYKSITNGFPQWYKERLLQSLSEDC